MRRLLVAGTVAIVAFATIGQLSHDHHVSLGGYAADALPLLGAWWVLTLSGRGFVTTWLAGVTVGVAIRAVALSHYEWNQFTFLLVALVFVGLIAWIVLLAQAFTERGSSRKIAA